MSYFPEDIPFMSKEELRENGIRIPKDATDINVGDTISRQQAIDIVVFECGKWTGLAKEISKQLKQLPPAQPEPTDINAKEAVYNLAEKIGIHQLFALTVELRGEPIQPEPQWIPVSERLPEDGKYMVTIHGYGWNGKIFTSVSVAECISKRWVGNNGVIAWMPLPEAYKPSK